MLVCSSWTLTHTGAIDVGLITIKVKFQTMEAYMIAPGRCIKKGRSFNEIS
jgi:hypothetical protein